MERKTNLKRVGANGQISIGKRHKGQLFRLERLPDGSILLEPVSLVKRVNLVDVKRTKLLLDFRTKPARKPERSYAQREADERRAAKKSRTPRP